MFKLSFTYKLIYMYETKKTVAFYLSLKHIKKFIVTIIEIKSCVAKYLLKSKINNDLIKNFF